MSWRYGVLVPAAALAASCGGLGHPAQGTVHGTFVSGMSGVIA
jgi:hypothetical protein